MNIAILHPALDIYGGAERQVLNLANELEKMGNEVTIYTSKLDTANCYPELSSKLNIVETGGFGWSKGIRYVAITAPIFMRIMAKKIQKDHDIINCHNPPSNVAAYFYKKSYNKIPVVWMCNEPASWYRDPDISKKRGLSIVYKLVKNYYIRLDQNAVRHIDKIIVLDSRKKESIKKIYGREAEIVRTGIDIKRLQSGDLKIAINKYNLEDKIVILTVNRLERQKNIDDLIVAISLLKTEFPNIVGVIVGDGPQKKYLKQLTRKLNCTENIIFTGFVTDEELVSLYHACDIFVFPATEQTWGMTPLEAMVCGKPSIVSLGAGVSEVLGDGVNSLLIPQNNPQMIADKIKYLINNEDIYNLLSRNGKEFVIKNLSWEKYAKNMLNIFEKIINS